MRYEIEMHKPSEEFARCWHAAGCHLSDRGQGSLSWLKCDLIPPFLEHLSFRVGNQIIFIRVEDSGGILPTPGNPYGVQKIADCCNGIACNMPMQLVGGEWVSEFPDWGLLDLRSGVPIDPIALISNEKFLMTDWELHDFAVQIVRDHVTKKLGHQLMSSQGNPKVDPSLWFVGDEGPEWVLVKEVKAPKIKPEIPANIQDIADSCSHMSIKGHFAPVVIASAQGPDAANDINCEQKLWRGYGMKVAFSELQPLS